MGACQLLVNNVSNACGPIIEFIRKLLMSGIYMPIVTTRPSTRIMDFTDALLRSPRITSHDSVLGCAIAHTAYTVYMYIGEFLSIKT